MDSAAGEASRKERMDLPPGSIPVKTKENTHGLEPASLSTTEFPATRDRVSGAAPPPASATPIWLMRIWVIIRVAFFIELGMVLVLLPWTRLWIENSLLLGYPELGLFLQNNFVRGLISGLGFIDLGFGIWEAIHYKEPRGQKPS